MDLIEINGLVFTGMHGVYKKERAQPQRFGVDVGVAYDARRAGVSDRIADAVDYAPIRDIVCKVIQQQSHNLIEKIATTIANHILVDSRISSARVTVRKLDLWDNGTPSITITRPS